MKCFAKSLHRDSWTEGIVFAVMLTVSIIYCSQAQFQKSSFIHYCKIANLEFFGTESDNIFTLLFVLRGYYRNIRLSTDKIKNILIWIVLDRFMEFILSTDPCFILVFVETSFSEMHFWKITFVWNLTNVWLWLN